MKMRERCNQRCHDTCCKVLLGAKMEHKNVWWQLGYHLPEKLHELQIFGNIFLGLWVEEVQGVRAVLLGKPHCGVVWVHNACSC